jgi:glycosyltransferase involved in cell wall biosynthesis
MSRTEAPLVSVVVPAFNAEATLGETLRSIAAQSWRPIEVVIVDDGSSDGTAALAARFCRAEPRARLIGQANRGVAAARNAGIAASSGRFVAPCDADDLWHPTKIEKQVAAALAAPRPPGFVYCWSRLIDPAGNVVADMEPLALGGDAFELLWARNAVGNGSALLIDRAAALELGGYDEGLRRAGLQGCEDVLLQLRLAEWHPVEVVPEFLVGYRIGDGRMSGDPERMFRSWRAAARKVERRPRLRARRWNLGHRLLTLAEQRAWRRRPFGAAGALLAALAADPRRTAAWLAYRSARTLAKPFRATRPIRLRPFLECDPAEPGPGDPHALEGWRARLARLDARRLEALPRDA